MSGEMMTCGCAAQGVCSGIGGRIVEPPIPVCITHNCVEVASAPPSLDERRARCTYFGTGGFRSYACNYQARTGCSKKRCACELPSASTLPFFEYRGPGSREAVEGCAHCGYFRVAHENAGPRGGKAQPCRHFEPRGDRGYDCFYCGCAGWD